MHFVTILTPGDWFMFMLMGLVAAFFTLLFVVSLYEKARKRFARFMSGSWWVGPPR